MSTLALIENVLSQKQYSDFARVITAGQPEVSRATSLFQKSQSQFMDSMLTVSHITPIRNLRQILAEIKRIKMAIGEAYFSVKKKELDIRDKEEKLKSANGIESEKLKMEIQEQQWLIAEIKASMEGAIRKWANYTLQYQAIQEAHNLQNFTEEDFEKEEEQYHICKAFEQGLNAARAHGGFIDEGNQIYLSQIGINGTVAQVEVANYLNKEAAMLSKGIEPSHKMQLDWLLSMAEKFRGCSKKYATWKGMSDTKQADALIREVQNGHI